MDGEAILGLCFGAAFAWGAVYRVPASGMTRLRRGAGAAAIVAGVFALGEMAWGTARWPGGTAMLLVATMLASVGAPKLLHRRLAASTATTSHEVGNDGSDRLIGAGLIVAAGLVAAAAVAGALLERAR